MTNVCLTKPMTIDFQLNNGLEIIKDLVTHHAKISIQVYYLFRKQKCHSNKSQLVKKNLILSGSRRLQHSMLIDTIQTPI